MLAINSFDGRAGFDSAFMPVVVQSGLRLWGNSEPPVNITLMIVQVQKTSLIFSAVLARCILAGIKQHSNFQTFSGFQGHLKVIKNLIY